MAGLQNKRNNQGTHIGLYLMHSTELRFRDREKREKKSCQTGKL